MKTPEQHNQVFSKLAKSLKDSLEYEEITSNLEIPVTDINANCLFDGHGIKKCIKDCENFPDAVVVSMVIVLMSEEARLGGKYSPEHIGEAARNYVEELTITRKISTDKCKTLRIIKSN